MDEEIDLDQEIEIDTSIPSAYIPIVEAQAIPVNDNDGNNDGNKKNVQPFLHHTAALSPDQMNKLKALGFPSGLVQELGNTRIKYPLRFWVVDNSGSMQISDGHQVRRSQTSAGSQATVRVVGCTRWTELQASVEFHADLAGILEATTVFRLLNNPGPHVGPQEFTVAETNIGTSDVTSDVQMAKSIISRATPNGVTPLTQHVLDIRQRIASIQQELRENGQQAVIVLATDGMPSNDSGESPDSVKQEFISAMKSLQSLPIWIVVRLCTDNKEVVHFFNNLDAMLEVPLEVIDDFIGEAKGVYRANPWLNYALPLHRCREMGFHHRVMDLIDERLLNKDELKSFMVLLFGRSAMEMAPDPNMDWSGFRSIVKKNVLAEGMQWNPITREMEPWINLKRLDKSYGKGFLSFFG